MVTMTPEELFNLVEPQRASGEMEAIWTSRCKLRRCHQAGAYALRDGQVVIVTPFKVSPARSAELCIPQRVPGRAWLGTRIPKGTRFGCAHELCEEC